MRALSAAYRELIFERRRQLPFWMLLAFLVTVIVTRLMVYTQPDVYVLLWGTHLHHFVWGIVILAIVAFVAIVEPHKYSGPLAVLYGICIGLIADESALWLKLSDVYHSRISIEIMIGIFLLLASIVYFKDFWIRAWKILLRIHLK